MSVENEIGQIMPGYVAVRLRRMHRRNDPALNETLRRYVVAGWKQQTLAITMRVDHGTIRNRVATAERAIREGRPLPEGVFIVVGPPGSQGIRGVSRSATGDPRYAEGRQKAVELLTVSEVRRMRRLQKLATCCVNGSGDGSPERRASEELTQLLWDLYQNGVPLIVLDGILRISHSTTYSRLSKHGYLRPKPSDVRNGRIYKNLPAQKAIIKAGMDYSGEVE